MKCQHCGKEIFRYSDDPMIRISQIREQQVPYYCGYCGEPMPWVQDLLDDATELIEYEDLLSNEEKEILKHELPYLIVDLPRSGLSAIKTRDLLIDKQFTYDAFWNVIKNFAPPVVKGIMTAVEHKNK